MYLSEHYVGPVASAMNLNLSGRSALITVAVSSIGQACAGRLAGAGAVVTMLNLNGDDVREVADRELAR